jgi:hypothetical protein
MTDNVPTADPFDFVTRCLSEGDTFDTIASQVGIWDEADLSKKPLSASKLQAWYMEERARRFPDSQEITNK